MLPFTESLKNRVDDSLAMFPRTEALNYAEDKI